MASTYLTRTPSSQGNRRTWTWSGWIKMSSVTSRMSLFSANNAQNNNQWVELRTNTSGTLSFSWWSESVFTTNQVFRDPSAWYHIVLAVDTTQATDTNRVKCYVNGEQVTSFSSITYPTQNYDTGMFMTTPHDIGRLAYSSNFYFDGYMADINFIDGTQYAASDFGQTDSTGIWKPKGFSGTYGTNGAYLKMSNSGDLGADSSGNGNNFTKSGNGRQTTDTPSNVFATINALQKTSSSQLLSEGNLEHRTTGNWMYLPANMGASSGKWYAEVKLTDATNFNVGVMQLGGVADNTLLMNTNNTVLGAQIDSWVLFGNGSDTGTYKNYSLEGANNYGNIATNFPSNIVVNDIIMIAMDCDNQKIWFGVNGSWDNSGDPVAGTNPMPTNASMTVGETFTFGSGPEQATHQWNFGNPIFTISSGNTDDNGYGNFEYAPPSGYLALCTKNLATELAPTIDDGSQYFNTALYTGNGTTQSITGVGFQPDWTWIKERSSTSGHEVYDSTRGATKLLSPNTTDAEGTNPSALTSFDSDGFSVGSGGAVNENSQTYVGWNWLANAGSTSSNTDGSITSTVQANTTAGFSIVTYTGTGSNATVGHGLGVVPKMIIVKSRTSADPWPVYHHQNTSAPETDVLLLSATDATTDNNTYWNDTAPTSSVYSVGTSGRVNRNTTTYVAYCFAEIEGYSKFGSYTGNTLTDGPFIYTGFKPAFVIIKNTGNTSNWNMLDSTRNTYNATKNRLYPNLSSAEEVMSDGLDFVSNGFKLRQPTNNDQNQAYTYVYMAFAEHPFVTSGGLPVTAR
jgi:hypothetical protein